MRKAVWDYKSHYDPNDAPDTFDCMIAFSLLNDGQGIAELTDALKTYKVQSIDEVVKMQLVKLSDNPKLLSLFTSIEMPLITVLHSMETNGITLNQKELHKIGNEIQTAIEKLQKEILTHIGYEINLNSSQQVGVFLAEKEGVPLGKTKTGKYATNESELSKFKDGFPIIQQILEFRELAKLKSTYVDSLIQKIATDGRIHTTYHQVGIATGRLASSNPNLQNIPDNSMFGNKIKSCFIASKNHTLISFDYSQQELRILAHLSGEEKLIDAFQNKQDVHKITAAQIFSIPQTEVTKEQRAIGKTINFGIIYGMGPYGLSEALRIPEHDAQMFISNFFSNFPKIKKYYDHYITQGLVNGYVETILGRRRYIIKQPHQKFIDNATRRMLLNFPIQGSAADLMKKAMVEVYNQIILKEPDARLLLQIHDDLVFEIVNDNPEKTKKIIGEIRNVLCNVYPLKVPIEVDIKTGLQWGSMEPYAR